MREDKLKIRITGTDAVIPAKSFASVMLNVLAILRDVDMSIARSKKPTLDWQIQHISMNSPAEAIMFPQAVTEIDFGREVLAMACAGLDQIKRQPDAMPDHFRHQTVDSARKIAATLSAGLSSIDLSSPYADTVSFTPSVMAHARDIVKTHVGEYESYASFRGRIEEVSVHGGSNVFKIQEPVYGYIACTFGEELVIQLKNGLLLERVAIHGRAKYSADNRPFFIRVDRIERLRSRTELPQFSDLEKIRIGSGAGLLDGFEM